MVLKRRNFTREFKLDILRETESRPASQVCREHNINEALVSKWRREYQLNPEKAFSGSGNVWKEEAELVKYQQLVGQLYAEITFLKKSLENLQQRNIEQKAKRQISE